LGVGIYQSDNLGLELSYRVGENITATIEGVSGDLSYNAIILDAYYYFNTSKKDYKFFAFAGVGKYEVTGKISFAGYSEEESKSEIAPRLGFGVKSTFDDFFVRPSIEYTALNIDLDGEEFISGIYEFNLGIGFEF
jgi:hypothetical protein